ncbi:unnamed protein product [Spodoptera littoralis]|uniref:Ribosomal protein eL8/eL30/eS12/Gadd45 domain-containing protein n=1 Tax=Spodoptera littoralis TaxID=7109 RepID=A0A9P0N464_SPOLI|nr:unnamed protein product [Spodoptera littoralis]CAH1639234.1 unnamed protein product [Spodoptera littoralis]
MEAATLPKKKTTISKGKLKKTIKNVLCRPDPLFWPEVTEDEGKKLENVLNKHKIIIEVFKKPHWKDLKDLPKEQRPKPPKLKKPEGLLFGVRECTESVQNGECSAIIIEAKVNPRLIVQPVVELCTTKGVPYICLNNLRKVSMVNFGVPTSCLGIKRDCLLDIKKEIAYLAKNHPATRLPKQNKENDTIEENMDIETIIDNHEANTDNHGANKVTEVTPFKFLYRTSKSTRVFVPTTTENMSKTNKKFIGQSFIEFSDKQKDSKTYRKMLLKRMSNNPNRVKKK